MQRKQRQAAAGKKSKATKAKTRKKAKKRRQAESPPSTETEDESDSDGGQTGVDEFARSVKLLTVTITQMPLGIGFDTRGGPQYLAIHHFNVGPNGEPRQAELSGKLQPGDQLVIVGKIEVQPLKFTEVVNLLTSSPLPLRLQFLRTTTFHLSVREWMHCHAWPAWLVDIVGWHFIPFVYKLATVHTTRRP